MQLPRVVLQERKWPDQRRGLFRSGEQSSSADRVQPAPCKDRDWDWDWDWGWFFSEEEGGERTERPDTWMRELRGSCPSVE
jgi:hypothetical protein